jgi:cysteine desulfuration protein SufE
MSDPLIDFQSRHAALLASLQALRDPQERLSWVVAQARRHPAYNPADRTDDRLVPGCAARLWSRASFENGRCRFAIDSDSAILKAMAGLLCMLYDGLTPEEVAAHEPAFLEQADLLRQLTENRRRTILRVRDVMRAFAQECLSASAAAA